MEKLADFLYDLPKDYSMFFDLVHYTLCIQGERADIGTDFDRISRQNPVALWFSSMLTCFAGGLLVTPLCGEPVLDSLFGDPQRLLAATVIWYLIFYSPRDAVNNVLNQTPAKAPIGLVKALYYPKKILAGIKHSKHVFKGNFLAAVVIATLKGNGSGMIKPISRLARGVWRPLSSETMFPSVTTKLCVVSAALYIVYAQDVTYVFLVGLFVALKLGPVFGMPFEPFKRIEEALSPIFFGDFKGKND